MEQVPPRPLTPQGRQTDALIALGMMGLAVASTYLSALGLGAPLKHGPGWAAVAASAYMAPLALRRRHPCAVGLVVSAGYAVAAEVVGVEPFVSQVALFGAFYTIGAQVDDRRRADRVRALIVVGMAAWLVLSTVRWFAAPEIAERGVTGYFSFVLLLWAVNVAFFGGAWVFGNRSWQSWCDRNEIERQQAAILAQQAELSSNALDLERLRIARELHDVVAHHVTAMGVQAQAARRLLARDPDAAGRQLSGVERSSRDAIAELRQVVRTLRGADGTTAPLPGLADVDDLITHARGLGQRVELHHIDATPAVSPAVGLTVYRIVQEALTNARKHAGPAARVEVRLRAVDANLEVDISDDGRGQRLGVGGVGAGIAGMTERARAVGGTLSAGPKTRGGWLVRAVVPTLGEAP